jgi:hypothetical protein
MTFFTTIKHLLALATLSLTLAGPAFSQEGGLYAAPPPPDAAFVRVLNGTNKAIATELGGIAFAVQPQTISPYSIVTRGDYTANGDIVLSAKVEAQHFYTILVGPDGQGALLTDEPLANPARAGLYFYNATGAPLDLAATVGGKQAKVFEAVAPGMQAFREVNAFDVTFDVLKGGAVAFTLPGITMARQQGVSVVALNDGNKLIAIQAVNGVAPTSN